MLYFGFKQDYDFVKKAAEAHLDKTLDSESHWTSKEIIAGVPRGIHIFPEAAIELPGFEDCKAVARAYESDVNAVIEGPGLERKIEQVKSLRPKHSVILNVNGTGVCLDAEAPYALRAENPKAPHKYVMEITWPVRDSSFPQFLEELWDDSPWLLCERSFIIEAQTHSVIPRPDLAYMLVGPKAPKPGKEMPGWTRTVYTPTAHELFEPPIRTGTKGGSTIVHVISGDPTSVQDHCEDGHPIGAPMDLTAETCADGHPID